MKRILQTPSFSHLASLVVVVAVLIAIISSGQPSPAPEPGGILRKPIPDRLVVLTFDDAPASHATVVAPILKDLGFGGSFYVCDFDSFKTRKDWYLTWRQMIGLDAAGFEIGNHTVGHYGTLGAFQAMEDALAANGGPRPTTVCWPLYQVDHAICPELSATGYTFGRGGHERPYRPTVDNRSRASSSRRRWPATGTWWFSVSTACRTWSIRESAWSRRCSRR